VVTLQQCRLQISPQNTAANLIWDCAAGQWKTDANGNA